MRIPVIQQTCYRPYISRINEKPNQIELSANCEENFTLPTHFYISQINFGHRNACELKQLFRLGLPCIYTGIEMLDPKKVTKFLKQDFSKETAKNICKKLTPYQDSMLGIEKRVFLSLKEQANIDSNKNLKTVMQNLKSSHEEALIKKQLPILKTISSYAYSLDDDLRMELNGLIQSTEDKIHNLPTICEFNPKEFVYKLNKIKNDIYKLHNKKAFISISHTNEICKNLDLSGTKKSIHRNKKIIKKFENYIKNSPLKDYQPIKNLINTSKAQLNGNKVIIPFSRKSFIFDLSKIINKSDDSNIKEIIMKVADKLPTSKKSPEAFIAKYSKESPEKIIYRLLWPSIATVEHLQPKSTGGLDEMANYAGACAQANSDRQSIPFAEWITRYPDTAKHCQKYIDRLIDYANRGILASERINPKYIKEFKDAIAYQSKGEIVLDISKLNKKNRLFETEPVSKCLNLN